MPLVATAVNFLLSLALTSAEKFPGDLLQGRSPAHSVIKLVACDEKRQVGSQWNDKLKIKTRKSKILLIRGTNEGGGATTSREDYYFVPLFHQRNELNFIVLHQVSLGIDFEICA